MTTSASRDSRCGTKLLPTSLSGELTDDLTADNSEPDSPEGRLPRSLRGPAENDAAGATHAEGPRRIRRSRGRRRKHRYGRERHHRRSDRGQASRAGRGLLSGARHAAELRYCAYDWPLGEPQLPGLDGSWNYDLLAVVQEHKARWT